MKDDKNGKILNRGITMMFVGYSEDHAKNVFQMYNPIVSRIVQSTDTQCNLDGQDVSYQMGCRSYAAATNCDSTHQHSQ
jgi:hypothetical protein